MEKFQAMKRNKEIMQLLPDHLHLCLRVVMLGLLLSVPHWLPFLCSSTRFFFMETLPGFWALLSRRKCLFIISNVIIVVLLGESKLSRSASPKQPGIYESYVARFQILQKAAVAGGNDQLVCQANVAEATAVEAAPSVEETKEVVNNMSQEEECGKEEEEIDIEREEELEEERQEVVLVDEEEDELGLPAEELNRRVVDFIAKVNMQRKLEAKMFLLSC